jgi:hypothetical protein
MEKLFKKELVDEFQRHPLIQEALGGCGLMNTYDFLAWFDQTIIRKESSRRREMAESIYEMVVEHFTNIANSTCEKGVGHDYSKRSMKKVLESNDFDLLVILAPHWEKLKRDEFKVKPKLSLEKKRDHVLGFVIVERGECKRMATTYSINLICTRSSGKLAYKQYSRDAIEKRSRQRTRGGILLGAYLFCAKKYGQTHGILELAGAYTNIEGFFSYSKQGFVKDLMLFGIDCFKDYSNLPMSARLDGLTYEEIIGHASGDKRFELKTEEIKDDTGLIRFVPKTEEQRKIQKKMLPYCNLLYKSIYLEDHRMHLERGFDDAEIKIEEDFVDMFIHGYENENMEMPKLKDYHEFYRGMLRQFAIDFDYEESKSRSESKSVSKSISRKRVSIRRQLSAPSRLDILRKSKSKTVKRARSV